MYQQQPNVLQIHKNIFSVKSELQKCLAGVNPEQNNIFVLGDTGVGKSTFISMLLGAVFRYELKGSKYTINHFEDQKYPAIGNGYQSCTFKPSIYHSQGNTYYDPAGYLDTKGISQELINCYSNAKMFRFGCKTKILLVIQQKSLDVARGGSIPVLAKRLSQLFKEDFHKIIHSCQLIITKVDPSKKNYQKAIYEDIQSNLDSNMMWCSQSRKLFKTILQNKRIQFFLEPEHITPQTRETLKKSINNLPSFIIEKDTHVNLSSDAKIYIESLTKDLDKKINSTALDLKRHVISSFSDLDEKSKEEIQKELRMIKGAKSFLQIKPLDSGKEKDLRQFAGFLGMDEALLSQLTVLLDQIQFCTTLHEDLKSVNKIKDILQNAVTQCQVKLTKKLQKIASDEEMKQFTRKSEIERNQREKRYNNEMQQIIRAQKNFEEKMLNQITQQQKYFTQATTGMVNTLKDTFTNLITAANDREASRITAANNREAFLQRTIQNQTNLLNTPKEEVKPIVDTKQQQSRDNLTKALEKHSKDLEEERKRKQDLLRRRKKKIKKRR